MALLFANGQKKALFVLVIILSLSCAQAVEPFNVEDFEGTITISLSRDAIRAGLNWHIVNDENVEWVIDPSVGLDFVMWSRDEEASEEDYDLKNLTSVCFDCPTGYCLFGKESEDEESAAIPFCCGDGEVQDPSGLYEECDDGNNESNDGCSRFCQNECKEECDSNTNNNCNDSCQIAYCGDRIVNNNEQCDGGCENATIAGCITCSASCVVETYCGDGIVNGNEECDYRRINGGCDGARVSNCKSCGDPTEVHWLPAQRGYIRQDNVPDYFCQVLKCGDGIVTRNSNYREDCDPALVNEDGLPHWSVDYCDPISCEWKVKCGDNVLGTSFGHCENILNFN